MAEHDRRVKLVQTPNHGVANARNSGVRAMAPTSAFLLFLDADDVLAPDALRVLRRRLDREPTLGAALGSRSRIDEAGTLIEPAPASIPTYFADDRGVRELEMGDRIGYWHILPINPISTPGQCLIRVADLPPGDVFDQQYALCEDWEMWLRLARRRAIGVEHHEVLSYRDHQASTSKSYAVMYEQRAAVYEAQRNVVTLEERPRLRTAWRFGMFGFDAVCLRWARDRFKERDVVGSTRYLLRSLRCEAQYLRAVAKNEPHVDAALARSH